MAWPRTKPGSAEGTATWETVAVVAATLEATAWHRLTVGRGEKGPRTYDWAAVRIVEKRSAGPGPDGWLLVRRSVSVPSELAYYLSNAPADPLSWCWPRGPVPPGALRRLPRRAKAKPAPTSTKCAAGTVGSAILPSR